MNQLEVFYAVNKVKKKKVSYTQLGITSGGLGWARGYLEPIVNSKEVNLNPTSISLVPSYTHNLYYTSKNIT